MSRYDLSNKMIKIINIDILLRLNSRSNQIDISGHCPT
jgi:hypothetical protein